jgi:hypothetical protein
MVLSTSLSMIGVAPAISTLSPPAAPQMSGHLLIGPPIPALTLPAPLAALELNKACFDLTNTSKLMSLNQKFLNKLCKFHKVKVNATNKDVISHLQIQAAPEPLPALPPPASYPRVVPLISSLQHNVHCT